MDAKADKPMPVDVLLVSIHAPVMDANTVITDKIIARDVSIHAPVMDANHLSISYLPRPNVSIHAPVMDAKLGSH